MTTITMSSKHQFVLPSEARKKLGLRSGDRLIMKRLTSKEVTFVRQPRIEDFFGILPPGDEDAVVRIRKFRDSDR